MTKKDLKQVTENGLEVLHEMGYKITPKKRFTHEKWYDERKIKENGKLFAIVDVYNQADTICNRLNELFDENEQLKQQIQRLELKLQRERRATQKQHEKWSKQAETQIKELETKLQKIRDYAEQDGEVKQGVIEKVVFE